MLKQLNKKSTLFIFSTFVLFFTNTNVSWAVRNPNETKRTGRESKNLNTHIHANAILAPNAVDTPNTTKLITREKEVKSPSAVVTRDLRDLQKIEKVLPGKPKTEEEIGRALIDLLKKSPAWLGTVNPNHLRLDYVKIVSSVDGRAQDAYARFVQQYKGSDIEDSFVAFTLKILPDWTVISSASAQLYPALKFHAGVRRAGALTDDVVNRESVKSLRLEGQRIHKKHDRKKVRFINGEWRKVREIKYQESPYQSVIDENSDNTWIEDTRVYGTIQGKTEGRGILFDPTTTGTNLKVLKLKDLKLSTVSGAITYTDALGNYNFPTETSPTNVSAKLIGRWANVVSLKADNLFLLASANPDIASNFMFNPTNAPESATAQVNGYYHTTYIHDWVQARLAPYPLAALDVSFSVNVNINATCNAYYDGISINFYSAGSGCINTAYDTVVYHEYGHFVDDKIGGITNSGLSEGWGDILAAFATGQPIIGEGFFGAGTSIRRADNNYQYPPSGIDESHSLGQAWVGFAWHLRENLIATLGTTAGIATAENLIIPTLYANSKDIPTAVYDVLVRDDNDGNLANLTPHYTEIVNAATRHSIPLPENDVTSPAPITDLHILNQNTSATTLGWTATGDDGKTGKATRYDIRYSKSPIATESDFAAATVIVNSLAPLASGQSESFNVPPQIPNTTYYYAIKVFDNMNNASALSNIVTTQLKLKLILSENFETGAPGWTSNGLWHVATSRYNSPTKSFAYNNGTNYDTGARNSGSLITPAFTIPNSTKDLVVNFQQWVRTENFGIYDIRSVDISIDNGASWVSFPLKCNIELSKWFTDTAVFSGYAGKTAKLRFYFDTVDSVTNDMEGWYVDDVGIYVSEPPILNPIGAKSVDVGKTLTFSVLATDPSGQPLTYSVKSLPSGATFKDHVFTWSPTTSQVGAYSLEFTVFNGNLSTSEVVLITVNNPNNPDLIVKDIILSTSNLPAGGQLSMSDTIKNIGLSASGASNLSIHLSKDAVYGGTDDIVLSSANGFALPAGAEIETSRLLTVPDTTALGNYFICEQIDSTSIITETNESNNTLCSVTTLTVTPKALPDLIVTTMSGPAVYIKGSSVIVNATIKNQGAGAAGNFWVAYFVSTDPIITTSDKIVGLQNLASLAPSASYNSTAATYTINLAPGTYYWGAYVDDVNSQPETSETNNSLVGNVVVISELTAPILNSATAENAQVTLNWSSVAQATSYSVKYGTSPGVYSGAINVGNVTSRTIGGLKNGTTYYFVVVANNSGVSSANSNEKSATPQDLLANAKIAIDNYFKAIAEGKDTVALKLALDAAMAAIVNPADQTTAGTYYNTAALTTAKAAIDKFFTAISTGVSSDAEKAILNTAMSAVLNPADQTTAGTYYNTAALTTAKAAIDKFFTTISTGVNSDAEKAILNTAMSAVLNPADQTTAGTYYNTAALATAKTAIDNYFTAIATGVNSDATKAILNTAMSAILNPADQTTAGTYYNTAASATAKTAIDNYINAIVEGKDATGMKSILDTSMAAILNPADQSAANTYYNSALIRTVKPVLNSATAGNAQVVLNWNSVPNATGYNIMYGTVSGTYATLINAGNVTSFTVSSLTNGITYYFTIVAINDVGTSAKSNEVNATTNKPTPDLVISSLSAPTSGKVGAALTITDTVRNQGTLAASGFYVGYYLSTDPIITTADTRVAYRYVSSLASAASSTGSVTANIPSITAGTYYWGAIADAFNGQTETNETNNVLTINTITLAPATADLVMSAMSAPTSAKAGSPVTVTDTVKNQGTDATGWFYVGYYLSTDPVITPTDTLFSYRYVSTVAAGASNSGSTTANFPNLPAGTYYWGAIADAFNYQGESNEANNAISTNSIAVAPSTADLVISSVTAPSSGKSGSSVNINGIVTNQGTGTTSGFYIAYYLSTDPIITTNDTALYYSYVPSLVGGASSTISTSVTLPNLPSGTYYWGAIADVFNSQAESNKTNNSLAGNTINLTGSAISTGSPNGN